MMTKRVECLGEVARMPDFIIALRPHTVWEKTPIKLFCTVQGNPRPIVKWSDPSPPPVIRTRTLRTDILVLMADWLQV